MWVDMHWHSRDEEQSTQDTVRHSLEVAEAAGLDALGAMPNPQRILDTPNRCEEYHGLSRGSSGKVAFFVHGGLTADYGKIMRMVDAVRRFHWLCGIKSYWGTSTGDLSIVEEDQQHESLRVLAHAGYEGVLVGHHEDESLMDVSLYDSLNPITWSKLCRPEEAEVRSFKKILAMAEDVGFKGTLHVAHISTTTVVDLIDNYTGPIALSCGVTPHHVFRDWTYLQGPDGVHYKCNPPLRSPETQQGLLERLMDGRIPILESDHAPHTEERKRGDNPPSGVASGPAWPYVVRELLNRGMGDEAVHAACFQNAVDLYTLDVECNVRSVDWARLEKLQGDYAFDAFKDLK